MRIVFVNILIIFLISGCISAKRFNRLALNKYVHDATECDSLSTSAISFKTEKLVPLKEGIRSVKFKSDFIPLIIYWKEENMVKCELDPKMEANKIASNIFAFIESSEFEKKLGGQHLDISFLAVPNTFVYAQKDLLIFLFYYYYTKQSEILAPAPKQILRISYELHKNDTLTKSGILEIPCKDLPMNSYKSSTRKFIESYIQLHETTIREISKEAFDKLIIAVQE
jgi:hypothetical protein